MSKINNSNKNNNNKSNNKKKFVQDDKLKPLFPSLRTKKRFIKIKIESDKKIDFRELSESINEQIIIFLGAIEFGKSGIWILKDKFNFEEQTLVLKVSTQTCDKLIGVLSLLQKINNNLININIINVSGTLKGLEKIKTLKK